MHSSVTKILCKLTRKEFHRCFTCVNSNLHLVHLHVNVNVVGFVTDKNYSKAFLDLEMVSLLWKAVALRWNIFFLTSSTITLEEYLSLYLKQFGFSASQVGLTTLMGVLLLFIPFLDTWAIDFEPEN